MRRVAPRLASVATETELDLLGDEVAKLGQQIATDTRNVLWRTSVAGEDVAQVAQMLSAGFGRATVPVPSVQPGATSQTTVR